MERRAFGKTDMAVSILGFGAYEIGEAVPLQTVERLLGSALDAGLNVIDTAECYGSSEQLIGKAIGHRRQDYYLFTKCGHRSGFDLPDWSPALLAQSIDRSLQRLQTEYVDLVQLHSCSEQLLRDGEAIDVLERARKAGKTRYIGYSGDGRAALYAIQCGRFDTLQTSVNIADQEAVELTLPEAAQRGVGVIAKRPIANAVWVTGQKPANPNRHSYWNRLLELDYEFMRGDLRQSDMQRSDMQRSDLQRSDMHQSDLRQSDFRQSDVHQSDLRQSDLQQSDVQQSVETALRFTLGLPGVSTAIVGTANPERWVQNAAYAAKGPLPDAQTAAIRSRWRAVSEDKQWGGEI